MSEISSDELRRTAAEIRAGAVELVHIAGSGHPGGSLSVADILAVLYFDTMNVRPDEPSWPERDRLVLSKGHACPALYSALALRGYFSREHFAGFRSLGGLLQGHPEVGIPGVDAPSGSLGMGLSQGIGLALAARATGRPYRTFVVLGDGDMQEGSTWEALMFAGARHLPGLVAVLDANGRQGDDLVSRQLDFEPITDKVRSFGWRVTEIDGHDIEALRKVLNEADGELPLFVVARTVKGRGVSFMEDEQFWHGSVAISDDQLATCCTELGVDVPSRRIGVS